MKPERIKNGNSFEVVYSIVLDVNGEPEPVDLSAVQGLVVSLQVKGLKDSRIEVPYVIQENVLTVSVNEALPRSNAYYRLVVQFEYDGNTFDRNPVAFQIVENVEEEGRGCGCDDIDIKRIEIKEELEYERGRHGSIINVVDNLPAVGVPGEFYAIPESI